MIGQLYHVFHKVVMTDQKQDGKSHGIRRDGNDRFQQVAKTLFWLSKTISTAQERSMNHETPAPARWRNDLEDDRLVAPDEAMPAFDHPAKKIRV